MFTDVSDLFLSKMHKATVMVFNKMYCITAIVKLIFAKNSNRLCSTSTVGYEILHVGTMFNM